VNGGIAPFILNPLKTKRKLLKAQFVPRRKHFLS